MSKESKPRDRHRQSIEAIRDRPHEYCIGCGYHPVTHRAEHRPDCTRNRTRAHELGLCGLSPGRTCALCTKEKTA